MRILFVIDSNLTSNPYVKTLCDSLNKMGVNAVMSLSEFWNNIEIYDIVHFQWPEAIYSWKSSISQHQVEALELQIIKAKKRKTRIAITCHNLRPHTISDSNVLALYEVIYRNCDLFLHMGEYSKQKLSELYNNAKHFILPHHIYDSLYRFNKPKKECRVHLNIPEKACCILSFGEFRNDSERNLIIQLKKELQGKEFVFLTPGFYRKRIISKNPIETIRRICKYIRYKQLGIKFKSNFINDSDTEEYFCAADIVFIQRINILNSGNLPMGFAAGTVVVGPNIGNVGCILTETKNPTFDIKNKNSIIEAITKANKLYQLNKGKENKEYAIQHWSTSNIAKQLIDIYKTL